MRLIADLVWHGLYAIRMLDRKPPKDNPYMVSLHAKLRTGAHSSLRLAAERLVTDLDVDVVKDLMKIVKKLRNGETGGSAEFDRIKLTLELMDKTIDKKHPLSHDSAVWVFSKIYKELEPIERQERIKNQS